MERGSLDKLKHDTRLTNRNSWIDPSDRDAYIDSLPDVADKITVAEESPAPEATSSDSLASAPPSPPSPPFGEVSE